MLCALRWFEEWETVYQHGEPDWKTACIFIHGWPAVSQILSHFEGIGCFERTKLEMVCSITPISTGLTEETIANLILFLSNRRRTAWPNLRTASPNLSHPKKRDVLCALRWFEEWETVYQHGEPDWKTACIFIHGWPAVSQILSHFEGIGCFERTKLEMVCSITPISTGLTEETIANLILFLSNRRRTAWPNLRTASPNLSHPKKLPQ